ncbi:hypothetical protein CTI12_AA209780 [Artemisia annua]|uniref:Uncharacterized protein n=1 Tax=Artemisia annua TaxID=35608 RepID=A0A2U1P051_ARTAN|nr:hypothetical protein CTI12_AA209780 [Artemisia annua]
MSAITFQTNTQSPHRMWTCNMHDSGSSRFSTGGGGNHWISKLPVVKEEDDDDDRSTDSSSSIGVNSDGGDDVADGEVTSKDNNGLLGGLETALPIKRGISNFYAGKSKSYGSLANAVKVSSIEEIVKKEDAYSRKRKNMIAHTVLLEKLRNSSSENVVSKRVARCAEGGETANTSSLMVGGGLPPLHRNGRRVLSDGSLDSSRGVYRSPWRSLSLSDLQHASGVPGLFDIRACLEIIGYQAGCSFALYPVVDNFLLSNIYGENPTWVTCQFSAYAGRCYGTADRLLDFISLLQRDVNLFASGTYCFLLSNIYGENPTWVTCQFSAYAGRCYGTADRLLDFISLLQRDTLARQHVNWKWHQLVTLKLTGRINKSSRATTA